jgi:hypothetical protein
MTMRNDPGETINLAKDPSYKKILDQLRKECDSQIEKYTRK